jgi:hypothetical protein
MWAPPSRSSDSPCIPFGSDLGLLRILLSTCPRALSTTGVATTLPCLRAPGLHPTILTSTRPHTYTARTPTMLKKHAAKLKLKPRSHSKPARGRALSCSAPARAVTVGVRREDPARVWERRCPLTPDAAHELVRHGARVLVQPCERRVFDVREFVEVRSCFPRSVRRPSLHSFWPMHPRVCSCSWLACECVC